MNFLQTLGDKKRNLKLFRTDCLLNNELKFFSDLTTKRFAHLYVFKIEQNRTLQKQNSEGSEIKSELWPAM